MRSTVLRTWPIALVIGGVALLLCHPGASPQIAGATYLGSATCKMCHQKTVQTKVYDAWAATKHAQVKPAEGAPPDEVFRHVTGYDPATGTYKETGVACEDCHGPGSKHIMAATQPDKQILNPAKMTPALQLSVCGQCHSVGTAPDGSKYPKGFQVGQDLLKWGWKLTASADIPADVKLRQLNDLQLSQHIKNDITCLNCHTAHGTIEATPQLRKPLNQLCLDCHDGTKAHQCTKNFSPDQKCSDCHMPNKLHTFVVPKS